MTFYVGAKEVELSVTGSDIQNLAGQLDEVSLIVRSNLIFEQIVGDFIRIAIGEDVFSDARLQFSQKLSIARGLGFNNELYKFIAKFNSIRNKFAHSHNYVVSEADVESLRVLANNALPNPKLEVKNSTICNYEFHVKARDRVENFSITTNYQNASKRERLLIIILMAMGPKTIAFMEAAINQIKIMPIRESLESFKEKLGTAKFPPQ